MTTVANHHESLLNWHFAATFFVPARQPLRFILRFESVVTYPDESEIKDPALTLHAAVASELAVHVDAAERRYRRFRQRFREDISIWHEEPGIVVDHAADVFRKLAALALRTTATDFKAFERAIEWDGGAAEIAFWYAHHLYKVVQHGRMPSAATRFITPGRRKARGMWD